MTFMEKMASNIIFGLFSMLLLFQINQVYGVEELPVITIDFVSGNIIDLDKTQMIRAEIQIQNYDPQDGYHFMEIIRLSDGEIIKNTEILPKVIDDNLYGVQILHYLEPGTDKSDLIGDYALRIYSEFGTGEVVSIFSIISSSMPLDITQTPLEESSIPEEESVENVVSLQNDSIQSESKIPSWVHDIFVWYAEETISESELLTAIEYLITQEIINVHSN